ncbi:hypothetical protein PCE1_003870 [Barthelona sp. PCE]
MGINILYLCLYLTLFVGCIGTTKYIRVFDEVDCKPPIDEYENVKSFKEAFSKINSGPTVIYVCFGAYTEDEGKLEGNFASNVSIIGIPHSNVPPHLTFDLKVTNLETSYAKGYFSAKKIGSTNPFSVHALSTSFESTRITHIEVANITTFDEASFLIKLRSISHGRISISTQTKLDGEKLYFANFRIDKEDGLNWMLNVDLINNEPHFMMEDNIIAELFIYKVNYYTNVPIVVNNFECSHCEMTKISNLFTKSALICPTVPNIKFIEGKMDKLSFVPLVDNAEIQLFDLTNNLTVWNDIADHRGVIRIMSIENDFFLHVSELRNSSVVCNTFVSNIIFHNFESAIYSVLYDGISMLKKYMVYELFMEGIGDVSFHNCEFSALKINSQQYRAKLNNTIIHRLVRDIKIQSIIDSKLVFSEHNNEYGNIRIANPVVEIKNSQFINFTIIPFIVNDNLFEIFDFNNNSLVFGCRYNPISSYTGNYIFFVLKLISENVLSSFDFINVQYIIPQQMIMRYRDTGRISILKDNEQEYSVDEDSVLVVGNITTNAESFLFDIYMNEFANFFITNINNVVLSSEYSPFLGYERKFYITSCYLVELSVQDQLSMSISDCEIQRLSFRSNSIEVNNVTILEPSVIMCDTFLAKNSSLNEMRGSINDFQITEISGTFKNSLKIGKLTVYDGCFISLLGSGWMDRLTLRDMNCSNCIQVEEWLFGLVEFTNVVMEDCTLFLTMTELEIMVSSFTHSMLRFYANHYKSSNNIWNRVSFAEGSRISSSRLFVRNDIFTRVTFPDSCLFATNNDDIEASFLLEVDVNKVLGCMLLVDSNDQGTIGGRVNNEENEGKFTLIKVDDYSQELFLSVNDLIITSVSSSYPIISQQSIVFYITGEQLNISSSTPVFFAKTVEIRHSLISSLNTLFIREGTFATLYLKVVDLVNWWNVSFSAYRITGNVYYSTEQDIDHILFKSTYSELMITLNGVEPKYLVQTVILEDLSVVPHETVYCHQDFAQENCTSIYFDYIEDITLIEKSYSHIVEVWMNAQTTSPDFQPNFLVFNQETQESLPYRVFEVWYDFGSVIDLVLIHPFNMVPQILTNARYCDAGSRYMEGTYCVRCTLNEIQLTDNFEGNHCERIENKELHNKIEGSTFMLTERETIIVTNKSENAFILAKCMRHCQEGSFDFSMEQYPNCDEGYIGSFCSKCSEDAHYLPLEGSCVICPDLLSSIMYIGFFLLIALSIISFLNWGHIFPWHMILGHEPAFKEFGAVRLTKTIVSFFFSLLPFIPYKSSDETVNYKFSISNEAFYNAVQCVIQRTGINMKHTTVPIALFTFNMTVLIVISLFGLGTRSKNTHKREKFLSINAAVASLTFPHILANSVLLLIPISIESQFKFKTTGFSHFRPLLEPHLSFESGADFIPYLLSSLFGFALCFILTRIIVKESVLEHSFVSVGYRNAFLFLPFVITLIRAVITLLAITTDQYSMLVILYGICLIFFFFKIQPMVFKFLNDFFGWIVMIALITDISLAYVVAESYSIVTTLIFFFIPGLVIFTIVKSSSSTDFDVSGSIQMPLVEKQPFFI